MFSTDRFSYKNKVFSAEISDFADRQDELFKPISPGALLKGFRLESARTGVIISMVLVETHFDRDNDLTHWTFKTIDHPAVKELIVFND